VIVHTSITIELIGGVSSAVTPLSSSSGLLFFVIVHTSITIELISRISSAVTPL
jgi:hypothetical protein